MKVPILIPNIFNHPFTYNSDLNFKSWGLCSGTLWKVRGDGSCVG